MKNNKYEYSQVIQQNFGQGWEDVSHYETDSNYINREKYGSFREGKNGRMIEISLISHDLAEYRFTGYPTRLINRRELKPVTDQQRRDSIMCATQRQPNR